MREDCRHYESRTYASGEVMRMCRIDFAPDAPWRCPDGCVGYERRGAGAGWTVGTLASPPPPAEPDLEGAAALLDAAEEVINAVGPDIVAEVEHQRAREAEPEPFWRKLFRRR